MLASWSKTIPDIRAKHILYQFVAEGTAIHERDTPESFGSSRFAFPNKSEAHYGEAPWVSPGSSFFTRGEAFKDMSEELQDNEHITIFIKTVTCYRRRNAFAPRLSVLSKKAKKK
jgi:hypothetical protein